MQTIGRCQYEKTVTLVVSYFDSTARSYQDLMQQGSPDVRLQEGRFAECALVPYVYVYRDVHSSIAQSQFFRIPTFTMQSIVSSFGRQWGK